MFVVNIEGAVSMDKAKEIREIKEIISKLSMENKKYVIAVANALLFSQSQANTSYRELEKCGKNLS